MSGMILKLKPVLQEKIWGGDRLNTVFGYDIPSGHTGECWAISGHPGGDCRWRTRRLPGRPWGPCGGSGGTSSETCPGTSIPCSSRSSTPGRT